MKKHLSQQEVNSIVDATMRLLGARKKEPENFTFELQYLAKFIETLLYNALTIKLPAELTKRERQKTIQHNFKVMKYVMQEAIAHAVQEAIFSVSKAQTDYICTIRPVQANKSKISH